MNISIIICFYERLNYLRCCLDALKSCSGDFDEVVIADDGSSEIVVDELKKLIVHYNFPIIHAWHERNGARRAACRNNGIRHASGDYLIFLDADFIVLPNAIKSHVLAAKPGRFVAGRCKYLTKEQSERVFKATVSEELLEELYRQLPEETIIKEHRKFVKYGILRRLHLAGPRKQTFGGHFSVYRKNIETVNGYDENFMGWGGEDLDLALRLSKAGFDGYSVIRTAKVLHLWHPRELGDKHWKEGPNIKYFDRKHIHFFCKNGLRKHSANFHLSN